MKSIDFFNNGIPKTRKSQKKKTNKFCFYITICMYVCEWKWNSFYNSSFINIIYKEITASLWIWLVIDAAKSSHPYHHHPAYPLRLHLSFHLNHWPDGFQSNNDKYKHLKFHPKLVQQNQQPTNNANLMA